MDEETILWTQFQDHCKSTLNGLRQNWMFSDVTLICEDGSEQFKAHKIVLAASCLVFKNMFQSDSSQQSTVFLRGVKKQELGLLLDYIYTGEVKVGLDLLGDFWKLANDLKLSTTIRRQENGSDKALEIKKNETKTPTPVHEVVKMEQVLKKENLEYSELDIKEESIDIFDDDFEMTNNDISDLNNEPWQSVIEKATKNCVDDKEEAKETSQVSKDSRDDTLRKRMRVSDAATKSEASDNHVQSKPRRRRAKQGARKSTGGLRPRRFWKCKVVEGEEHFVSMEPCCQRNRNGSGDCVLAYSTREYWPCKVYVTRHHYELTEPSCEKIAPYRCRHHFQSPIKSKA